MCLVRRRFDEWNNHIHHMKQIGEVTSGTFSPSLNKPIAMAYVAKDYSAEGAKVSMGKMRVGAS